MWTYKPVTTPEELYHYGILGQKWGVRRYQNEDGTLTPSGKIRYGNNNEFSNRPKSREKNVTGSGKTIYKHGSALKNTYATRKQEQTKNTSSYPVGSGGGSASDKEEDYGYHGFWYDGNWELHEEYPGAYEDFKNGKEHPEKWASNQKTEPDYAPKDFRIDARSRKKRYDTNDTQHAEQPVKKKGKEIYKHGEGLKYLEETKKQRAKLDQAYKEAQKQSVSELNASSGIIQSVQNTLFSIKDAAIGSFNSISSLVSNIKDSIFGEEMTVTVWDATGQPETTVLSSKHKK